MSEDGAKFRLTEAQARQAWEAGGPPLWYTQTTDKTTGEQSQGHYLLSYTGADAARSIRELWAQFDKSKSFAFPVKQVRANLVAYFLALYRRNSDYATHDLDVRVYGPFKCTIEEAQRLVFPKGVPLR